MENQPIRVMLVDDHIHVHEAIVETLALSQDVVLVARAYNGLEAVTLCGRFKPDLILMDIVMPKLNGIEATKQILADCPTVKILALSSFQDRESVRAMIENGAVGFVLKDDGSDDLVDIIRTAHKGKSVFSADIMNVLMDGNTPKNKQTFDLTERELEILKLISDGLNYGEIAAHLFISYSTVRFHIKNIIAKMKVTSRTEAISLASKMGLV